jgi:glucosyl-3-phosphoglycerate phosphatase
MLAALPSPQGPRKSVTRRLVLLRHGQTEWNSLGRAQGHADLSLDATGHAQAAAAAPYLAAMHPVRLWSSDLARAQETAGYVADATGLTIETDPRLREYDVGVRSGLTVAEFEATYPREYAAWLAHDESLLVEGEESSTQVRQRVLPALTDCLDALRAGETGVVVMHGACLRVGLLAVLGWPPETSRGLRGMDNCGWTVLGDHEIFGGLRMVSYNETASVGQHPDRAAGGDFASDEAVG